MIQIRVYNLWRLISHWAHSRHSWDTRVDKIADFTSCILFHTLVFTHACGRSWHGADLQDSHISSVSPSCLLFSLSVFAGSLQSGVIAVRGYTDAFCCVLCSSSVDLLVTGASGAGAPPAGLKGKMRPVCWFQTRTERLIVLKSLRAKPGEHQFDLTHNKGR